MLSGSSRGRSVGSRDPWPDLQIRLLKTCWRNIEDNRVCGAACAQASPIGDGRKELLRCRSDVSSAPFGAVVVGRGVERRLAAVCAADSNWARERAIDRNGLAVVCRGHHATAGAEDRAAVGSRPATSGDLAGSRAWTTRPGPGVSPGGCCYSVRDIGHGRGGGGHSTRSRATSHDRMLPV